MLIFQDSWYVNEIKKDSDQHRICLKTLVYTGHMAVISNQMVVYN